MVSAIELIIQAQSRQFRLARVTHNRNTQTSQSVPFRSRWPRNGGPIRSNKIRHQTGLLAPGSLRADGEGGTNAHLVIFANSWRWGPHPFAWMFPYSLVWVMESLTRRWSSPITGTKHMQPCLELHNVGDWTRGLQFKQGDRSGWVCWNGGYADFFSGGWDSKSIMPHCAPYFFRTLEIYTSCSLFTLIHTIVIQPWARGNSWPLRETITFNFSTVSWIGRRYSSSGSKRVAIWMTKLLSDAKRKALKHNTLVFATPPSRTATEAVDDHGTGMVCWCAQIKLDLGDYIVGIYTAHNLR